MSDRIIPEFQAEPVTALAISEAIEWVVLADSEYPVDFDDAWKWVGYSSKGNAKTLLQKEFSEGQDFFCEPRKSTGGRPGEEIYLTKDCFKAFCMMAGTEKGRKVRTYFIEVEKKYFKPAKPMSQLDMVIAMATVAKEHEERLKQQEARLTLLEAKNETSTNEFFTIAGYASLRGELVDISKASLLGRRATKISKETDTPIGKLTDPRFGQVNTYLSQKSIPLLRHQFTK